MLSNISPCQLHTYLTNRNTFSFVTCETDADDVQQYDCMVKENALAIRRTEVTEVICVLDLDPDAEMTCSHVAVDSCDTDARRFSAVHSDIKEAEHVTPGLSSSEGRELVTSSRAPH